MVATFVTQCLLSPQLTQPADKPWLILLLEMSMTTPALQTSSLALSIAALGRSYGDEALIHESVKMYVRGLSELQRALWRPRLACQDETLAACLTLGLYELMECPGKGPQAYASHCSGLLSLIQHRGPYAYTSGLSHKLFQATRLQGVCEHPAEFTVLLTAHSGSVCNGTALPYIPCRSHLDASSLD